MEINIDTTTVILRKVVPPDGMVIHKISENQYFLDEKNQPTILYLGKEEDPSDFEYISMEDVPEEIFLKT